MAIHKEPAPEFPLLLLPLDADEAAWENLSHAQRLDVVEQSILFMSKGWITPVYALEYTAYALTHVMSQADYIKQIDYLIQMVAMGMTSTPLQYEEHVFSAAYVRSAFRSMFATLLATLTSGNRAKMRAKMRQVAPDML